MSDSTIWNADSEPTRFGLLRHAKTVWNQEGRIQGQWDSPLTPEGEARAGEWGVLLSKCPWDCILASDLGRTRRTAEWINQTLALPLSIDPRLREMDWGDWSGKTFARVREENPTLWNEMQGAGWSFRPPGGEDRSEVWNRSREALAEARRRWPGRRILVVTHEGVIKCLIYRLLDRRFLPAEPSVLEPVQLHRLIHGEGGLGIERINAFSLDASSLPTASS